ncbi:MAG TPA: hypothetical protein VJ179_03025 [Patescibacteria group bacterium]|nr:hypothetical protein [Patescibacteria group bacterium]
MQQTDVAEILRKAKTVLLMLPEKPTIDEVAAGVALYLSFQSTDKKLEIVCSTQLTVSYSDIIGVDQVKKEGANRNLVITFDWQEGATQKVTYDVVDDKFRFVVHPEPGKSPLRAENVEFTYEGVMADLIVTVGVGSLEELGVRHTQEKQLFSQSPVIAIDNTSSHQKFGAVNLVNEEAASVSELIVDFMREHDLPVDVDIATNLLTGMSAATSNFQSSQASANTFEAAAACLAAGARRIPVREKKGEITLEKEEESQKKKGKDEQPSPDWFEPKIYKGSSLDKS